MGPSLIDLRGVGKRYALETRPWRRMWQQLLGRSDAGPRFEALQGIDLQVQRGEVVGIVGRNGAGKSTLLQIVCGVLDPSEGQRRVHGRIAALLELGAGFNPELTGRENVRLNAALLGLSGREIEQRLPEILAFADIGDFVDQPVRSYSSGMFIRLAFAMATAVDPDILIIDEALSVGDGAFARKSFDRIMALKERGATILFCSHSTYQVEAICSRAIWLEQGRLHMVGDAARVIAAYNDFIGASAAGISAVPPPAGPAPSEVAPSEVAPSESLTEAEPEPEPDFTRQEPAFRQGHGRVLQVTARAGGQTGRALKLHTLRDDLTVEMAFAIDPTLPPPTMIIALYSRANVLVASAGSHNDGHVLCRDERGLGRAALTLRRLPLLKGEYHINVILACERGLHFYENAMYAVRLQVTQDGLEQGFVTLAHEWS